VTIKDEQGGRPLTPKKELFCREYMVDMDATKAAIRVGYAASNAAHQGCNLLKEPAVAAFIQRELAKREKKLTLSADRVLSELSIIAFADPIKMLGKDGGLLPLHEMPEEIRRAIAAVEVEQLYAGAGSNKAQVGQVIKIKFWPKGHALETLGKYFKLWVERLELSGKVEIAERLQAARKRRAEALPAPASAEGKKEGVQA
jgi:phage terminase small subunit